MSKDLYEALDKVTGDLGRIVRGMGLDPEKYSGYIEAKQALASYTPEPEGRDELAIGFAEHLFDFGHRIKDDLWHMNGDNEGSEPKTTAQLLTEYKNNKQ